MWLTHLYLHGMDTAKHRYLQGENWSQAWFYFQEKQQVINLYLIIETNGLTCSQAEHNALKKPEVLIKTRDFSTWPLTPSKLSKSSVKATESFILDKIRFEIPYVYLPASSVARSKASTCQRNHHRRCWGPRRYSSKTRRSCTNLLPNAASGALHPKADIAGA